MQLHTEVRIQGRTWMLGSFASCLESIFPILPLSPDTEMYQGFLLPSIVVDSLISLAMMKLGVLFRKVCLQDIKSTESHRC
jgi:hypothetical protein